MRALELPSGRRVRGSSVRHPPADAEGVDLAVVLTGFRPRRALAQEMRWVRWPDFGLPVSTSDAVDALTEAHDTAAGAPDASRSVEGPSGRERGETPNERCGR